VSDLKIVIIGKRNLMGSNPRIRVKGLSRIGYNFDWDKEIKYYAYSPKSQKDADDIFRTQGRLYRHMFFSVCIGDIKPEVESPKPEVESPKPKAKSPKPKKKE
jgi:hypothetical protein